MQKGNEAVVAYCAEQLADMVDAAPTHVELRQAANSASEIYTIVNEYRSLAVEKAIATRPGATDEERAGVKFIERDQQRRSYDSAATAPTVAAAKAEFAAATRKAELGKLAYAAANGTSAKKPNPSPKGGRGSGGAKSSRGAGSTGGSGKARAPARNAAQPSGPTSGSESA